MERNYEKCSHYIKQATEKGADMVCLPEHFAFHDKHSIRNNMTFNTSQPEALDLILDRYKMLALNNRVWLSLGCFPEVELDKNTDTMNYFNTHYIVNADGAIVSKYRKMHLFDT